MPGRRKADWPAPAGVARAVEGELRMKRKKPMPRYYGKNIVQHAQKKFLQHKELEADREKRRDRPAGVVDAGKKE